MSTGTPFGKLTRVELKIHAFAWNRVGDDTGPSAHEWEVSAPLFERLSNAAHVDRVCANSTRKAEAARRASIARRA